MLLSPTARTAIRALIYLASRAGEGPIPGREIADAEKIPAPYLAKILHTLGSHNLVKSRKGPRGGYEIAQPADQLIIGQVVEAIDGTSGLDGTCILGLETCGDENPCALHSTWKLFRGQLRSKIWDLKLSQAAKTMRQNARH